MDESVYDVSLQSESNPNIFIKKDWISILDNQNRFILVIKVLLIHRN